MIQKRIFFLMMLSVLCVVLVALLGSFKEAYSKSKAPAGDRIAKHEVMGGDRNSEKDDSLEVQQSAYGSQTAQKSAESDGSLTLNQKELIASFKLISEIQDDFYLQRNERAALQALLVNKSNLEESVSILSNPKRTLELYGLDQAMTRVYAIKMLTEQARLGDRKPLLQAAAALADSLTQQLTTGAAIEKKWDEDLRDLLSVSVDLFSPEEISANIRGVAESMGFTAELAPQVVSTYDEALFFSLRRKYDRVTASRIVGNLIPVAQKH